MELTGGEGRGRFTLDCENVVRKSNRSIKNQGVRARVYGKIMMINLIFRDRGLGFGVQSSGARVMV